MTDLLLEKRLQAMEFRIRELELRLAALEGERGIPLRPLRGAEAARVPVPSVEEAASIP